MSTDLPDFLSDEPSSAPEIAPAAAPEGQAPEAAAASSEPAGEQPQPQTDATPATATVEPPAHAVPLTTFLDMREKLSAAEKRAAELETWRQQQEEAARRQQAAAPDPTHDPAGFASHQAQQIGLMLFCERRDTSRRFAEMQHGKELVDEAWKWGEARCDEDPHFNAKVAQSPDPAGFILGEFRNEQTLKQASSMTPEDFTAFQAWKAAQAAGASPAGQSQPAAAPAASTKPAAPRASIASGPSAGESAGVIPRDGAATFDAMFAS